MQLVHVNWIRILEQGWDTHNDNFNALRERLLPPTDQALAALFDDMEARGLLDDTLVIVMGEFGRSPQITRSNAGREHWPQVAFAMLGHFRGGPAKAAVLGSAATGLISGSSVANVVTTGTFTIPLMKRVGYPAVKSGAIEVSSSVNGQIMPPVMGAAAFLIAEYVGISYAEVVRHAIIPAALTYLSLFYVVDIEARKHYDTYTRAREEMLRATHTDFAPWTLVDFNDQALGRLTLLRDFLDRVPDTELPLPEIPWPALEQPPFKEEYGLLEPIPNIEIPDDVDTFAPPRDFE